MQPKDRIPPYTLRHIIHVMSCRGVNKTLCRSEQDYMYRILPKASSSIGSSCPTRRHRLFFPFSFSFFLFLFGAFNSVNLEGLIIHYQQYLGGS